MKKKALSLLERVQERARANSRTNDWHPIDGLYDIFFEAKMGGNVEPDLGLALSALKAMLPYVASPLSAMAHEPASPDATAAEAKAKLRSLVSQKIVSIEDVANAAD